MKKEVKPEVKPVEQQNISGTFIKRESHLGYRAYSIVITDGKAKVDPLHPSPDIQGIALQIAYDYLSGTL